ncbi:hypothetical protein RFI_11760 [Reticulomyxa filosa]|uniref:Uncharacterized protein n=1 Tax=Reticulomyxa filosa TaxID=46433 RepID=X6NJ79_RETFI|nr:hypothetical protein RFI_11760 [Reticulomyxa filosa]|eukprot:ETO25377.1 hypothetical protein RFI_11760 [Reticulomyxa filosa]
MCKKSETVATLDVFGGILPKEFKCNLNETMSYLVVDSVDSNHGSNGNPLGLISTQGKGEDGCNVSTRKQYNFYSPRYLHDRILRIVDESYQFYPTTQPPLSFPDSMRTWAKEDQKKDNEQENEKDNDNAETEKDKAAKQIKVLCFIKKEKEKVKTKPDRSIKIIRSKDDVFWNLAAYFQLFDLPFGFLFGGQKEFEQGLTYVQSNDKTGVRANSTDVPTVAKEYLLAALPHHIWCIAHRKAKEEDDEMIKQVNN